MSPPTERGLAPLTPAALLDIRARVLVERYSERAETSLRLEQQFRATGREAMARECAATAKAWRRAVQIALEVFTDAPPAVDFDPSTGAGTL